MSTHPTLVAHLSNPEDEAIIASTEWNKMLVGIHEFTFKIGAALTSMLQLPFAGRRGFLLQQRNLKVKISIVPGGGYRICRRAGASDAAGRQRGPAPDATVHCDVRPCGTSPLPLPAPCLPPGPASTAR
ncbi:unnamed protein product [Pleuronectes platessa]|uniref:Uncharacterized protein n=1 Tax=Pleuronectes platessa TaxID=8262 RepID=A0A9N7V3M8_PLEPL|nr:unnamed protein product [Pleuronectes platessa]